MSKTSTALKSLYAGGQVREQTVLTPDWILDAVRAAFGGTIVLDPCASPDKETHFAQYNYTGEVGDGDGLVGRWVDRTYCNPPYKNLRGWIEKAFDEARDDSRIILLIPHRPHRRWYFPNLTGSEIVYLAPFAFKGHTSAFPAPIVLVSWNCKIPPLGKRETYRQVVT